MGYDTTRFVKRKPLREVLIEQGVVSGPQLDAVLGKLENGRGPLGQALVAEGLLSAEQLGRALAAQYGLTYEPLTEYRVDPRFYQTIPVELMYRHPFVPLAEQDGLLVIAIHDPGNLPALDELELLLKHPLRLVVSTKDAILAVLTRSEGSSQALKDIEADYRPILLREDERGDEVLSIEKIAKDQSPVVKLVDTIVLNALQRRASDVHVEATDRAVHVKYRIDGILTPALDPLDLKLHAPLISRIKVMSELDIAERRVPQDGRFRIRLDRKTVDFRVSILPSAFGEVVVIRILDKEYIAAGVAALRLDRLGFNPEDLRRFRRSITEPYGMVLVTGPTGSGKTTSLYAAISDQRDQCAREQGHHDRGSGRIPTRRCGADPGQREKGVDLCPRPALDSPSRSGQDHGGRDPGCRDRADRDSVGADGPSGLHHSPCEQRLRRDRPVCEHGDRTVQLRLLAELHSGSATGADDLRCLPGRDPAGSRAGRGVGAQL